MEAGKESQNEQNGRNVKNKSGKIEVIGNSRVNRNRGKMEKSENEQNGGMRKRSK